MGLHDRLGQVVRANLTDISINSKDPEHDVDNALLDMQASLVQMRQALISAMATHKRTQQQHTLALAEVNKWQKRAQLALETGKEELAAQALIKKKTFVSNAASLKAQLEQQASSVKMLKRNVMTWESKVAEAKERKNLLKSRIEAVEAKAQPQKTINGSISASANPTNLTTRLRLQPVEELDRADLEILLGKLDESCDVEAELAKFREMLGVTNTKVKQPKLLQANHDNSYEILVAVNQLEQKLQQVIELSQAAFQELAELKNQLQDSRKSGGASYDKTVDMELAAMKFNLDQL